MNKKGGAGGPIHATFGSITAQNSCIDFVCRCDVHVWACTYIWKPEVDMKYLLLFLPLSE